MLKNVRMKLASSLVEPYAKRSASAYKFHSYILRFNLNPLFMAYHKIIKSDLFHTPETSLFAPSKTIFPFKGGRFIERKLMGFDLFAVQNFICCFGSTSAPGVSGDVSQTLRQLSAVCARPVLRVGQGYRRVQTVLAGPAAGREQLVTVRVRFERCQKEVGGDVGPERPSWLLPQSA